MTIKLGLIGKNISHSKSPELYNRFLELDHSYDLLDYSSKDQLPRSEDLLAKYDGINITSPYKEYYLNEVRLQEYAKDVSAINCLYKKNEIIFGDNTDYLACLELVEKYQVIDYQNIYILGNGPMARVLELILSSKKISYQKFSHSLGNSMDKLNFLPRSTFIINACSRDFHFVTTERIHGVFWDLNYSHSPNSKHISSHQNLKYIDGLELLELQALKAIELWNFPK